jgi:thiol-disulfide isomerase/thioredoxin
MTARRSGALLAVIAVLAFSACTARPSEDPAAGTIPAENATEAALLPRFADALPVMEPETFRRLLGQLQGTPVVVNFWGSWCPPCEEEMPRLVAAHDRYGDRVQFLGVDLQDSREGARAFIRKHGMRFPSVFDVPDAIKTDLGRFGQPVTVFYRADGSFSFAWTGPIPEDELRRHLEEIAG